VTPDAIVIGAGPNGLVAANVLADSGWTVEVLEANDEPGGAVRTGEIAAPGFRSDLFSAFYPLGAASPALSAMDLEDWGVTWRRSEITVAHPLSDGRCATLHRDLDVTAANLDTFAPGDGDAWRELFALWRRLGRHLLDGLFTPFPPVKPGVNLLRALGPEDLVRFVRFSLLPVRKLAQERFEGDGGPLLLAGNALHADLTPGSTAGGLYGWLLCCLGQSVGFPVPEGGAGRLTEALVRRLQARGGTVRTGVTVDRVIVHDGRAVGVEAAGERLEAQRAVLADVVAPRLFGGLVPAGDLPPGFVADVNRFQLDSATVKVDWALETPIPWAAEAARRAGTVHVTEGVDELSRHAGQLERGQIPDEPFLVLGQYASFDPTRAPEGGEAAWAYTHVPQVVKGDAGDAGLAGTWDEAETEAFADRMEAMVERLAPGFRRTIKARHVFTPRTMEQENPNLINGAINGGTAQLHQQVVFRPTPGLARPETPIRQLFLAGASAHPGGGVHGACGYNAARAGRGAERPLRRVMTRIGRRSVSGGARAARPRP
jgi:phytoene dehydrogenase-like protein